LQRTRKTKDNNCTSCEILGTGR